MTRVDLEMSAGQNQKCVKVENRAAGPNCLVHLRDMASGYSWKRRKERHLSVCFASVLVGEKDGKGLDQGGSLPEDPGVVLRTRPESGVSPIEE